MSALPIPQFELQSPLELAQLLQSAKTWREVEALTTSYPHLKVAAWELLTEGDKERIKTLKQWQDFAIAQKFPIGCTVQRIDDAEHLTGEVVQYWRAYGVEYVTFKVGADYDWCRGSLLEKV
ncbi:hypothetical protein K4A83_21260 [Spirulina subsalsa FACHB-351]|uniref:Uncharacterized protein n=1 Tax=Spirulina subsalsa FACHB-351 TaxID=234711 RepID=A0ABT3LB95_9CYAN|nr:hypothetical protein [Spirulina subsalsa]MCW6038778.1 hypothetical protein [Spirulina subsalsa FACHB-351]